VASAILPTSGWCSENRLLIKVARGTETDENLSHPLLRTLEVGSLVTIMLIIGRLGD